MNRPHNGISINSWYNFIMGEIVISVQFGRECVQVEAGPDSTFADIRKHVEKRLELVEGGVQLLYKGKKHNDKTTLASVGIKATCNSGGSSIPSSSTRAVVKMMALRTKLQHGSDAARQKSQRESAAVAKRANGNAAQKNEAGKGVGESTGKRSESQVEIGGDPNDEGKEYVLVTKGRKKYRVQVKLQDGATAKSVKERLCSFGGDWEGYSPGDIRILAKGRSLNNDDVLKDLGIRSGTSMIALRSLQRHAVVEKEEQFAIVAAQTQVLLNAVRSMANDINSRVLSSEESVVCIAEFKRECARLRANVDNEPEMSEDSLSLIVVKAKLEVIRQTLNQYSE